MTPKALRDLLLTQPTLTLTAFTVNGQPRTHKFMGIPRVCVKVRSKDFLLQQEGEPEPSYMDLPKSIELTGNEESFTITKSDGPNYILALTYKVVRKP